MNIICDHSMDDQTRKRYNFSISSFSRIFSKEKITKEMAEFCHAWALGEERAPLDCLNKVDEYFLDLWNQK